jgi:hypothetical protein
LRSIIVVLVMAGGPQLRRNLLIRDYLRDLCLSIAGRFSIQLTRVEDFVFAILAKKQER